MKLITKIRNAQIWQKVTQIWHKFAQSPICQQIARSTTFQAICLIILAIGWLFMSIISLPIWPIIGVILGPISQWDEHQDYRSAERSRLEHNDPVQAARWHKDGTKSLLLMPLSPFMGIFYALATWLFYGPNGFAAFLYLAWCLIHDKSSSAQEAT